jgi:hypothetical protein
VPVYIAKAIHFIHFTKKPKNMKNFWPCFALMVAAYSAHSQEWIPQGMNLLPDGYAVFSMSIVDDTALWIIASEKAVVESGSPVPSNHQILIFRSIDAGQTWETIIVEESTGRFSFDIQAESADEAWITTQDYNSGLGRAIYKTEDGGVTWQQKTMSGSAGVFIRLLEPNHIFCQANKGVTTSADDGVTWETHIIEGYGITDNEYNGVISGSNMACSVGDTIWVGTSEGRVVRSTLYGQAHEIFTAAPGKFIQCVSFADHEKGMLIYYNLNTGAYGLARSSDGGTTWSETPSKPDEVISCNLTFVPGTSATYVLTPDPYAIDHSYYVTNDFGETWRNGGTIGGENFNSVQFLNPTTGWLAAEKSTGNGSPLAYKWSGDLSTGTKSLDQSLTAFTLSPNPALDYISLHFDEELTEEQIQTLYDHTGKVIFSRKTNQKEIDIRALSPGLYTLNINSGNRTGSRSFIKLDSAD